MASAMIEPTSFEQTSPLVLYLLAVALPLWIFIGLYFYERVGELERASTSTPTASLPDEKLELQQDNKKAHHTIRSAARSTVIITVNGVTHRVENPSPRTTLLSYLRDELGLTGAKIGCGEGGCGACTVVAENGKAINACLRLLCACDGLSITTVEGLGTANAPSVEQQAIADGNGSQCGYCTPGWVMAAHGVKDKTNIERELDGNICRCTGYRPIVQSLRTITDIEDCATSCCMSSKQSDGLRIEDSARGVTYLAPASLTELLEAIDALSFDSNKMLIGGCTAAIGVSKYYDDCLWPWVGGLPPARDTTLVATKSVPELVASDGLRKIGAAVTISELIGILEANKLEAPARHLRRVANTQVRNSATWAGNLVLAARASGFISDVVAALSCCNARIEISSMIESRRRRTSRRMTRSYTDIEEILSVLKRAESSAVVLSLSIAAENDEQQAATTIYADKVAARHANAHAFANCGLVGRFSSSSSRIIEDARCVFGGCLRNGVRARGLERVLRGRTIDDSGLVADAVAAVRQACADSTSYAADLAAAFVYKWLQQMATGIAAQSLAVDRPQIEATQRIKGACDYSCAPISVPRPKLTARLQATGEAKYVTDEPLAKGELHCHFALANAAGQLQSVDTSVAKRVIGCVAVLTAADLAKRYGSVGSLADSDDPLLISLQSNVFVGSRVAIAVADSYQAAIEVARSVTCNVAAAATQDEVVDPRPALVAHLESGKWRTLGLPPPRLLQVTSDDRIKIECHRDATVSDDQCSVSGTLTTQSAKHFHMETHAARAKPLEGGVLEVWSSSQDNVLAQSTIGTVLGYPLHKVCVKCQRAGGGFGGKLTLHLAAACATAVVADTYAKPCRMHAERRDDMKMTGGREPCESHYVAVADKETLELVSYEVQFDAYTGQASSDGVGDVSMAVSWSDNVYRCTKSHVATGRAVKTTAPRNTSMRSPGVLQSHCVHELAMVHLAHVLGKPIYSIQEANFYRDGDETPYGNVIGQNGFNFTIPRLWRRCKPKYLERLALVEAFNAANMYRKRGVHLMPTKYVMGLSGWKIATFVVVYADGSVEVTTGGSEIGQGLYTKVAATVAYSLGCDLELVRVSATSTDKVPNSSCTGGSGTSESACNAAMLACGTLKSRLEPYLADGGVTWTDAVKAALGDNVELAATGWNNVQSDTTFDYATYGVGLAEVEIDCLTGEVSVIACDIEMDQGISLNADVDLGQIEGGFIMALGFYLTENNDIQADGTQSGDGTWEYKPPLIADIPLSFNVSMLSDSPNPCSVAVLRSKASGEPPMQLAACIYLAVRNAVAAARQSFANNTDWFVLPVPVTPKVIRSACLLSDDNLELCPTC